MEISQSQKQAYSEIDEFLDLITEEEKNQIPLKLREFFKREKDPNYHKGIDPNIPIKDQNLKSETIALIALLNLQYWCKDEEEKERLKQIYANNEKKYQEEIREKYSPDNIFNNKKQSLVETEKCIEEEIKNEENKMVVYKEPLIKRLFDKLLKIFRFK